MLDYSRKNLSRVARTLARSAPTTSVLAVMLLAMLGLGLGPIACASNGGSTASKSTDAPDMPEPGELAALGAQPRASASSEFWTHWGDAKAELSGYTGEVARYGELRSAKVALIYVTEPMDRRVWIKDDQADEDARINVLKLNHVAKFDTGIYPYSVMTSVFSPVDAWDRPRFQPAKISLTSQEWCGHVFHGVWPGPKRFLSQTHSYFSGEGDTQKIVETPADTLYEDALFIQLRELDGAFAGGKDWSGHLVPRLWERRKAHEQLTAVPATIERQDAELDGQAVTRFVLTYADKRAVYDIQKEHPRRILRWERSDGSHLRLEKTTRLPYWKLNQPGDRKHRDALGF
jgi:hypothetical protein